MTAPTKLTNVGTPPPKTIAMIDADAATAGSLYDILFVPYGLGPAGASNRLVIAVKQSKPAAGGREAIRVRGTQRACRHVDTAAR